MASATLVVASVVVTTMLASSHAHAELLRPTVPTLTWSSGLSAWMPAHEDRSALVTRIGIVWTPTFSAFSIGVSGLSSFRPRIQPALTLFGARQEPWSLCIGPTCPGRALTPAGDASASAKGGPSSDPDPGASAKAGSIRFIHELGPMAVAALGMFSNPVASEAHPVAMRLSPMFAFGGGGLEMRCAWW